MDGFYQRIEDLTEEKSAEREYKNIAGTGKVTEEKRMAGAIFFFCHKVSRKLHKKWGVKSG